jgi:hypothetical protein
VLARQVAADFGVHSDAIRLDLVAIRLRVVRQEGILEGIDQARKAITEEKTP